MSPAPFGPQERAVSRISYQIQKSIEPNGCEGCVCIGIDWVVNIDTEVRPDLKLVCGDQPERHPEKPPVIAVEVLSPSTSSKDKVQKRLLYEARQVEHYLILDTDTKAIAWYRLNDFGTYCDVSGEISEEGSFQITLRDGCEIALQGRQLLA